MKFEIVKLKRYSGVKSTIYSIIYEDDKVTLYEKFLNENLHDFSNDLELIKNRLLVIGNKAGAKDYFFKDKQGKPSDSLCYLKYQTGQDLRLYCIRFGDIAIILGGGGYKSKSTKAYQDDIKLKNETDKLKQINKRIDKAFKDGDLKWSKDTDELSGTLKIEDDE